MHIVHFTKMHIHYYIYKVLFALTALLSLGSTMASAQTITFDSKDYRAVGVYDTWEESPFRLGTLKGNCRVVNYEGQRMLGLQRSRYGSNTFGARIILTEPFELTKEVRYIHVMIQKPVSGRAMLVGLGKRRERTGQSPETEQFWVLTPTAIEADEWTDAVFPIKGNGGINIHSLVVVPDAESPHNLTEDFACYIDQIEVNDQPEPRLQHTNADKHDAQLSTDYCIVNNANRNGEVLTVDGQQLSNYKARYGKPLKIRMNPERGFTYDGIRIHYATGKTIGGQAEYADTVFHKKHFRKDCFTIPAKYMKGNVEIEGLFVEITTNGK